MERPSVPGKPGWLATGAWMQRDSNHYNVLYSGSQHWPCDESLICFKKEGMRWHQWYFQHTYQARTRPFPQRLLGRETEINPLWLPWLHLLNYFLSEQCGFPRLNQYPPNTELCFRGVSIWEEALSLMSVKIPLKLTAKDGTVESRRSVASVSIFAKYWTSCSLKLFLTLKSLWHNHSHCSKMDYQTHHGYFMTLYKTEHKIQDVQLHLGKLTPKSAIPYF